MEKNFTQDEWTKSFCLVFNELSEKQWIQKKKAFVAEMGLPAQSNLNQILAGERDYPMARRQRALEILSSKYFVNVEYFRSREHPMFTRNVGAPEFAVEQTPNRGMTYAELLECKKIKEENEFLKKSLADKEALIKTQARLIAELEGKK